MNTEEYSEKKNKSFSFFMSTGSIETSKSSKTLKK